MYSSGARYNSGKQETVDIVQCPKTYFLCTTYFEFVDFPGERKSQTIHSFAAKVMNISRHGEKILILTLAKLYLDAEKCCSNFEF